MRRGPGANGVQIGAHGGTRVDDPHKNFNFAYEICILDETLT